jgi:hypothetical protein
MEYIDLTKSVESRGFADLVHTNTYGEKIVANHMTDYISAREPITSGKD